MAGFLDFNELKARVSIEDAMRLCNLDMAKRGETYRGKCPVCEGSKDRDLVVTPSKNVFYCFRAKEGGDQIKLVTHLKGLAAREAALFLNGTDPKEKAKAETPSEGFKPLDYLVSDHDAVAALGLEAETAKRLGIGYAPRGILKGNVAFPIRTPDGRLAGYIGSTDVVLPPKWNF